ncbi:MAG: tryptophan-rich sensory protein [Phocaeicola dorei]|nr:tryptophan-rich sensory protein [Phocaeicola dorei]
MKKIIPILIAILICFGVGCTASYFQSEAILNWYPTLDKPSLTPPDMAFPIAWSLIYLCMGISIGLIWHMWTIRRQMLRSPLLGFANILVLDVLVVYYMIESYPVKKSSAYLFVPYLLWLILATYLNGYILMYN